MNAIYVCNALNTVDYDTIEGKPCIDYWCEKTSGLWFYCRACHSWIEPSNPVVGGHVIDFLSETPHVYITPIHDRCNKQRETLPYFFVSPTDLVRIPNPEEEQKILSDEDNIRQIKWMKEAFLTNLRQRFSGLI